MIAKSPAIAWQFAFGIVFLLSLIVRGVSGLFVGWIAAIGLTVLVYQKHRNKERDD